MSASQAQAPYINADMKIVVDGQPAPLWEVVIDGEALLHVRNARPYPPQMYRRSLEVVEGRTLLERVEIDWYAEGGAKILNPKTQ